MQLIRILKAAFIGLFCVTAVLSAGLVFYPFWQQVTAVEMPKGIVQSGHISGKPEEGLLACPDAAFLQVVYVVGEGQAQQIKKIVVEILNSATGQVSFLEVPMNSKIMLSADLYQKLQLYAPGMPQYLKLSKMAENFSAEYCMEGCTRILQEVLGVTLLHWVSADAQVWSAWEEALHSRQKNGSRLFFDSYEEWIAQTAGSDSVKERRMYYEAYAAAVCSEPEQVPGKVGVGEYIVLSVQTRGRIEELLRKR